MSRKKIALLSSQLEERYQSEFVKGFITEAFGHDYDVCIFTSFEKEPGSDSKDIGESKLYSLIDYQSFDGVVVMADLLQASGLVLSIEQQLRDQFKGTVLFVDRESKEFPCIRMVHYKPLYELTKHLIEDHGFHDIAFMTGHKWHTHFQERLQGFLDCMKDHGLTPDSDRIYYGDYWYTSGNQFVNKIIDTKTQMPEAFLCANDQMAIGVAEALTKHGYRVPEDVAVVGYDSILEGQMSPKPVTSVILPAREYGTFAARSFFELAAGNSINDFEYEPEIFYGSSCGCHCESVEKILGLKSVDQWNTGFSAWSYYEQFNNLTEDLVLQTSFKGLMDAIQTYTYQIREFDFYALCLDADWVSHPEDATTLHGNTSYPEQMVQILTCGRSGEGEDCLDYDARFDTKLMIPKLLEWRDQPAAFVFAPLYFEELNYGYCVINYGTECKGYDRIYYMWHRSVMTALECYRRNISNRSGKDEQESFEIHDALTGMFNYDGLVKHARPMVERARTSDFYVAVLAIDLAGLNEINKKFNRKKGDNAIRELAHIIKESAGEGDICCRLGNDEFIVATLTKTSDDKAVHQLIKNIDRLMEERNKKSGALYELRTYTGYSVNRVYNMNDLDQVINTAVSTKNGNKITEQKLEQTQASNNEEAEMLKLVKKILDENLFSYHFQPIVNAKDGSIYAYEALMRSNTERRVNPVEILKYAEHLDRLVDIEKATFFNVLSYIKENSGLFLNRKVFLNSIPGIQLSEEDTVKMHKELSQCDGQAVVELTEQTQADDDTLASMKKAYSRLGIETAVDDYGTGYSNIVNLLRYMPDYVKIDRMLLSGIHDNPQKQHFVKDVVIFAHENDIKVLAEGVEDEKELETVIRLGVDLIQGYYTARPNPEVLQQIAEEIKDQIVRFQNEEEN